MRVGGRLTAALGIALLVVLALSTTVAASFDWQSREGTVKWAEGFADGTHVYLDAVEISKIRAQQSPPYIVIAECFSWRDKLVAFTQPSPELRVGQTVDVEGDLTTTESGDRALTNVTVWGYTDSAGTLLYHGPLIKGLLEPTPWDYKVNLTVDFSPLRSETPSQPGEVTTDSSTEVQVCATIADAKANDVGTAVIIRCHPVSSGGTGSFVLGEDGSTDTLATNYTGTVSQTSRVCSVSGTIDTTDGTDRVLDVDSGPNYNVQESFQGSILTAPQGSVAWVKSWADGHTFATGDITGKIITRNWTDYLYIEDDTRACGIRVEKTAHGHVKGEVVSVEGTLATNSDGERYIAATTITQTGTGELTPLGMNNKWLGGGDFAYDPGPPVVGQRGIAGAAGLNNIGLLVRTWGKVTELDTASPAQWFLINDGSNVQTKVAYPPFSYAVDDYVTISGISSCEVDTNGDLQRVLRPQPLTCTIEQATGQSDPTNTSPVNFTVTFSESVTGFTADDVTLSGVTGATKTVTGSGTTYNVAISLPTAGTVVATVPAGVVQDNSGVWNYEATHTDNSVLFDNVVPTISNTSVSPTYSTGSFTITYTASDTGGSGLNKVKLWQKVSGEYQYTGIDLNPSPCGLTAPEGTYDLALTAVDNAGNESALTTLPQVIVDTTAPSAPTVTMDHVIPTSKLIHATWSEPTDPSGIYCYAYQFWYKDSGGNMYALTNQLYTTSREATCQLTNFPQLTTTSGLTYGIRVWAVDNAINVSDGADSSAIECKKVKVGFCYEWCIDGLPYYDYRGEVDTFLSNAATTNINYQKLYSHYPDDSYDVMIVVLPHEAATTSDLQSISSWLNRWHRRIILVGDNGYQMYTENGRLNNVAQNVGIGTAPNFDAARTTNPPNSWLDGIDTSRHCWVSSSTCLTRNVQWLYCASTGRFYSWAAVAVGDGGVDYRWIVEKSLTSGGHAVLIHDESMFNSSYYLSNQITFVRNICSVFE